MDAISWDSVAHRSREEVSLRAVTGRTRRRFSLPALPVQQLYEETDPHDARPTRVPAQLPVRHRTVERMGRMAASWKADAADRLSLPQESRAHSEAMRLQALSQAGMVAAAAPPNVQHRRENVQRAAGRQLTRSTPSMPQPEAPISRTALHAVDKRVTFARSNHVDEPNAVPNAPEVPYAQLQPAGSKPIVRRPVPSPSVPDVQQTLASIPSRPSPGPPIVKSSSPKPDSVTEAPKVTLAPSSPTMPQSQEAGQEAEQKVAAGESTEVRADSAEPLRENVDIEQIAESYLLYSPFLEDDEEIDRGRRHG
ncbi:uncharacterized protein RCC_11431 [Ramularia collo-cygni]|uniref:Uncharacterized protein n=1 Tax=Ramularia collo-cygni TaxID=112498 RepID=A0A2D3V628_9PEZI|nr:uncharacterized protein RCC_11431 [Ramularia collo-cygni]CZT25762.1 uncharacterized protein RCC_11431 [Ramularia collo-cygni]